MNIDIAETLVYSWLRHVKGCHIVHRNWKGVAQESMQISDDLCKAYEKAIHLGIISLKGKKDLVTQIRQDLKQTECDALGVNIQENNAGLHFHAVEVAYHANGLNYTKGNANKIGAKLFRIAVALKVYLSTKAATLYFTSPFVREKEVQNISKVIGQVKEALKPIDGASFEILTYFNESFYSDIPFAIRDTKKYNMDSSELYLRACDLELTYDKISKGEHVEDVDVSPEELKSMKIGMLVRTEFMRSLKEAARDGRLTEHDMRELQEWRLSSFPVLRRAADISDEDSRRYYATPLTLFGESYRVCNHWYKRNESKLQKWISRLDDRAPDFVLGRKNSN